MDGNSSMSLKNPDVNKGGYGKEGGPQGGFCFFCFFRCLEVSGDYHYPGIGSLLFTVVQGSRWRQ